MTGNEFIELAGRLVATQVADEASMRTAIGRAYYGAFHLATSFLNELGFATVGHGEPHQFLAESGNANAKRAGIILADLQSARIKADYRLDFAKAGSQPFAKQQVESAFQLRRELADCGNEAARSEIQESLRRYVARRGGSR